MSSNSAIRARIYPTRHQEKYLLKACEYRRHYYNALVMWYKDTRDTCKRLYAAFCDEHTDESERAEYMSSLPWPSKKITKEGLNDTCLRVVYDQVDKRYKSACVKGFCDTVPKGKYKGEVKNYGDIFRLNAVYMQSAFGESMANSNIAAWCKADFARAVQMTFDEKRIRMGLSNGELSRQSPKNFTFKITINSLDKSTSEQGRVKSIVIPFLSGSKRRKKVCSEVFNARLSDSLLNKAKSASSITVTRNSVGQWFASIAVEQDEKEHVDTGLECGIDLGIKQTATISQNVNGSDTCEDDLYYKRNLKTEKLKMYEAKKNHLQKLNSRCIKTWFRLEGQFMGKGLSMNGKGSHSATKYYYKNCQSNTFQRRKKRISEIELKIANIRKDFSERFSREIVDNYDSIGLEDLNVSGMVKNKKLSKSINREGFYQIRSAIKRKAGERVCLIDRWAPSSKTCSNCGFRLKKLSLSCRNWTCPSCGKFHDRDENAASNIRPSMQAKLLKNELLSMSNHDGVDEIKEVNSQTLDATRPLLISGGGDTVAVEGVPCEKFKSVQRTLNF